MKYPKIKIENTHISENKFVQKGKVWTVPNLLTEVKKAKLEPFDLPLSCIDIGVNIFDAIDTPKELADHIKRCEKTSLEYPVIMNEDGLIMDGWHRIVKALVAGLSSVKAVRFEKNPPCVFVKVDEDD